MVNLLSISIILYIVNIIIKLFIIILSLILSIIFLPFRLLISFFTLFTGKYKKKKIAIIKPKNGGNKAEGGSLVVDTEDLSQEERLDVWSEVEKTSHISSYDGYVEHGYTLKSVSNSDKCPRCHALTEQYYANYIYSTQIAARVMSAPAGYFCTKCPTVIIDEKMIKSGIKEKFKFQGVVGLDYEDREEPDLFKTWNGEKSLYIFDEHQNIMGLESIGSQSSNIKQMKWNNTKTKNRIAKQSRKQNRSKK